MTNAQIIAMNEDALRTKGIINEEETIHTYQGWKQLGMQVKRGSTAVAKFQIWKRGKGQTMKMKKAETGEEVDIETAKYFLTNASFFSTSQVEAIA